MVIFHSYVSLPEGMLNSQTYVNAVLLSEKDLCVRSTTEMDATQGAVSICVNRGLEDISTIFLWIFRGHAMLIGGLEHLLFSPIVGMMIQSDFHIFQGG